MSRSWFVLLSTVVVLAGWVGQVDIVQAHHFKGLPHFSYYENYPQVPQDEFLAQTGEFEMSLVIYDFQGIDRQDTEQPDEVRFYLVIFNLMDNKVYHGPLELTIRDGNEDVYTQRFESSEEESLYSISRQLSSEGDYSLQVKLSDGSERDANIPFVLSSQKISWGPWVAGWLIVLIGVTAIGSRRARVVMDRKANAQQSRVK